MYSAYSSDNFYLLVFSLSSNLLRTTLANSPYPGDRSKTEWESKNRDNAEGRKQCVEASDDAKILVWLDSVLSFTRESGKGRKRIKVSGRQSGLNRRLFPGATPHNHAGESKV